MTTVRDTSQAMLPVALRDVAFGACGHDLPEQTNTAGPSAVQALPEDPSFVWTCVRQAIDVEVNRIDMRSKPVKALWC